jgi:hypothetical protein
MVEPSLKHPGEVFVGTGGRGVFVRNVTSALADALLACEEEKNPRNFEKV